MAIFTLDNIREAADAKYGSTDITLGDGFTVRLLNPLRLPKEKRDSLMEVQKALDSTFETRTREAENERGEKFTEEYQYEIPSEVDQESVLADSIRLVAENNTAADRLLEACAGDLTMLVTVFEMYSKGTQAGEASASQD